MFRLACTLLFAVALSSQFALAQGPAREFFKPHAGALEKAGGGGRVPGVVSDAVPVEFNAEQMLGLTPGEEISLTLPNATSRAVVFELALDHGGGIHSWIGHFKGHGNDNRVILTTGPAGSYGVIDTPEGSFRIVPGSGHEWLVDMTQEQLHLPTMNLGDDALFPPPSSKGSFVTEGQVTYSVGIPGINTVGLGKVTPPLVNIDMMFVVTKKLADRLGAGLLTRLNFLVARANTSYADSEVGIILRLVNVTVVNYTDGGGNSTALYAITPPRPEFNAAVFGSIETIRSQVKADMVSFLRDGGTFSGSGIAWVGSTSPNDLYLYSVTTGCVAGCESVWIHEVGHNMGNMHDRATVAYQAGGTGSYGQGAQPYAYGYAFCKSGGLTCNPTLPNGAGGCGTSQPECAVADNSNFRDIMAYFQGSAQQTYKFSNPAVNCKTANGDAVDRPCGIVETATGVLITDGSANTAASMNTTRTPISAIKPGATNLPGIIQFTSSGSSGLEAGGPIVFTVSRNNGSAGPVQVSYATSSGTAMLGTDFSETSGTLSWADGETTSKTISVSVIPDAFSEGNESFKVTLSNPAGTLGVSLGYPFEAAGVILEPWPGGALPPGFFTPNGSSGAWTVATDQVLEGADSLRSAQVYGNGDFTTYVNSDLVYSGTLASGTVAFAYRVSSYQGYGLLEFIVDGTVVMNATGETGWRIFAYTLPTAGPHTLTWRFKNLLPSACNGGWNPPAEGGAACADRAWIDAVSLPLPSADLSLTQSPAPNPAAVGKDLVYMLTVANAGPATATSVSLTDTVPAGSTFIWTSPGCVNASGTVTCNLGSIASGANTQVKLVVRPTAAGNLSNSASVSSAVTDPNTANNASATNVTVNATPAGTPILRYRLYSPVTLEHHFTTDLNEYTVLGASGNWNQEGTVGKVLNNPGSFASVTAMPYYRLYNTTTRWHHWTTDANEYYTLILFPGWQGEGVDGYILPTAAAGTVQLFRLLYPFIAGLHHWTIDANEYNTLIGTYGWTGEGGSGFVIQ